MKLGEALRVGFLVAVGVTAVGCGGGTKPKTPQCLLNSDCAKLSTPGLVCALGYCVTPCATSSDCPNSERCVVLSALSSADGGTGADAGVAQGTACQAPELATCNYTSMCKMPLVCSADHQCRDQCETNIDCPMGQFCTSVTHLCADPSIDKDYNATINDFVVGTAGTGGSTGTAGKGGAGTAGTAGSAGTAGKGGGGTGASGAQCPSAQTQFGGTAHGDSNPNFICGIGLRTARQLLIFDNYKGPDPVGDGGTGTVAYIYVQAFDPVTGDSQGPATPLFASAAPTVWSCAESAAVAPTGEIMLINNPYPLGVWATFLTDSTPDGGTGTAGLHVVKSFQISTTADSQPQVAWSPSAKAFVVTNVYDGPLIRVQKFLPNGNSAGGSTDPVPTDNAGSTVSSYYNEGWTAGSNGVFGVAYGNSDTFAAFTALDSLGNQIGKAMLLPTGTTSTWETMGGTSAGFVYLYDVHASGGMGELLIPVSADGGIPLVQGSDAGLPGFKFPGTKAAVYAYAANDDVGGAGGVGVGILYQDNVSFVYVNADGVTHVGPSTVFSHTYTAQNGSIAPDYIHVNNVGGSFGVSLYSTTSNSVQAAATGCQ